MKISNVQKSFGSFRLDIDELRLAPGEICGLIGPNGCGKSTAVKLIAGLIAPDAGSIDTEGLTPRDITMVPRKPYLLRDTVYKNLVYPLRLRKITPDTKKVEYYLELTGLADRRNQYAPNLSGGEQQKLALVRALIFSPKLVLLDEGLSNMDLESGLAFQEHILQRQLQKPITWLVVSHQLAHIERLCSRVHFMNEGKITASGTAAEILHQGKDPALLRYLQSETLTVKERNEP